MSRFSIVVGVVVSVGCAKPCDRGDVQRVIEACRVEAAGPNIARCTGAAAPPATHDWLGGSVENCNDENAGELIACLSANASVCTDAGVDAALARCRGTGASSGGNGSERCLAACTSAELACSRQCPQTSWGACSSCQTTCTRTRRQCEHGCEWHL